jgi:hypothetical protein
MPIHRPSSKKNTIVSFPKEALRSAFRDSMPSIATEPFSEERIPLTYVPPSHARALDPNSILVEGIRGAGKSFWWSALNQKAHRDFVVQAFPETRLNPNMRVGPGYGLGSGIGQFPSKDIIRSLVMTYEPRDIWKAVIAKHLEFSPPFPLNGDWGQRVAWVSGNPEAYEKNLAEVDAALVQKKEIYVILFDALDRLAGNWSSLRPIAKSLFQVALDIRNYRAIRLKLFVRPDMLLDSEILGFPDSSKLKAEKVSLSWRKVDLFALAFQCLWNDIENGMIFRKSLLEILPGLFPPHQLTSNVLPQSLRVDEDCQKKVFHALAGPTMASGDSGHKRGFPYTWLPNHLADGMDQVSPRSFSEALREAASQELPQGWPYPIHLRGLQAGVQKASGIRVNCKIRSMVTG